MNWSQRRLSLDEGASAVEYAILVSLIAAVVVAVVIVLGTQTCETFETTSTEFAAASPTIPSAGTC